MAWLALVATATTRPAALAWRPRAASAPTTAAALAFLRVAGSALSHLAVVGLSLLAAVALARATPLDTGLTPPEALAPTGRLTDWLESSTETLQSPAICRKAAARLRLITPWIPKTSTSTTPLWNLPT